MNRSISELLHAATGFDWDEANTPKIRSRHEVTIKEVEEVFFNNPFVIIYDVKHSQAEERYGILGITSQGRKLAVYFTFRGTLIRPISARGFHQKELEKYLKRKAA